MQCAAGTNVSFLSFKLIFVIMIILNFYCRDDPKSDTCTVVSNTVSSGCTVKVLGSNIFSAVKYV